MTEVEFLSQVRLSKDLVFPRKLGYTFFLKKIGLGWWPDGFVSWDQRCVRFGVLLLVRLQVMVRDEKRQAVKSRQV